jgi:hypothetical protein
VYLSPRDVATQLEERARRLQADIELLVATRKRIVARVERINLLEEEYLHAMRRAELSWVRSVLEELRSRAFTWNVKEILKAVRAARRASTKGGGKRS